MSRWFTASLCPALCCLALLLSGCEALRMRTSANPFEIAHDEYPRMFRAAEEILREDGFALDRHDYRFGRIDTLPLAAPTIFEPWRPTTTTGTQALASTISQQQRIVIVTLEPVTPPPEQPPALANAPSSTQPAASTQSVSYMMKVEVQIQQMEVPARQLTGSTRGPFIQDVLGEAPYNLRERGIPNSYWRPVGRDPYLEQRLLAAIVKRSLHLQ